MKVRELLEVLTAHDPEAEVCLLTQSNWPLEHGLARVVARGDLMDAAVDSDAEAPLRLVDGAARSDVVLVEGRWLRYGTRAAWMVRR